MHSQFQLASGLRQGGQWLFQAKLPAPQNTTFQILKMRNIVRVHIESTKEKRSYFNQLVIGSKNSQFDLHLLIFRREFTVQPKEALRSEVPLASCEELQDIQTVENTLLHTNHAEK